MKHDDGTPKSMNNAFTLWKYDKTPSFAMSFQSNARNAANTTAHIESERSKGKDIRAVPGMGADWTTPAKEALKKSRLKVSP